MPAILSGFNKRQIWPCVVLVLLTIAIRIPLLGIPFERDEGEYAYIAWRLDHHELPYRDWIDQKPPAIFWVYRFAFLLPLEPVKSVHVMAMLFAAASACALYLLAFRFMGLWPAFIAGFLFMLLSSDPPLYGTEANTEMFMLFPLVLSVMAFFSAVSATDRYTELLFAVLAGLFTGIAIGFKQVAAVHWPFLVLMYPLFAGRGKPFTQMFSFALFSLAGIAVVWVAISLYFGLHHGFRDFIYNVFTHNLAYVQSVPGPRRLAYLGETLRKLSRDEWLVWICCAGGLLLLAYTRRTKEFLFMLLWLVTSMAGVSASGYFFPHYFQQLLPVMCLLAAFRIDGVSRLFIGKWFPSVPEWVCTLSLGLIIVIPVFIVRWPFLFSYSMAQAVDEIYPGSHFAEKQVLAERLAQVTKPDDKVFIFGADTEILFYAQRVSATRYIFLFPLYGPYSDAKEKQLTAANEIVSNAPAAMLYLPNQLFFTPGSEQYFTQWSQNYMKENFRMDSCLAVNKAGLVEVVTNVPNQKASVIDGLQVFGEMDVIKTSDKH